MNILVINCGSSSIKYQLLDMSSQRALFEGLLENIASPQCQLTHVEYSDKAEEKSVRPHTAANLSEAFEAITPLFQLIDNSASAPIIDAVGHRVVHGGELFSEPSVLEPSAIAAIEELNSLAPLHNPANLKGVEVCMRLLPDIPHVAIFDTAFHQTMPAYAYRYAVPKSWYEQYNIRRYGFHGTSHANVAKQASNYLRRPFADLNLITLHLGNGASVAAIQSGHCVDTSMGLTPLEGLIMGTRSGDIDPEIPTYMQNASGKSALEISAELNKKSGLLGICDTNDMREVEQRAQSGNEDAQLALDMFCYRVIKYVGAYKAVLGKIDAIIFTAGIGENSEMIRKKISQGLQGINVHLDDSKNQSGSGDVFEIQSKHSTCKLLVINTNEELEIAQQVYDRLAR